MNKRIEYEYAIVRFVPDVERGEFINVGVALLCRKQRYADLKFHLDESKIKTLYGDINLHLLKSHLQSFQNICTGIPTAGRIANLDQTERFRWLTANRSTIIQCSPTHVGLCFDAAETHEELYRKLVL